MGRNNFHQAVKHCELQQIILNNILNFKTDN